MPLVSDASRQMDAQAVPSGGNIGVPLRANSILQARVREAQYEDIAARRKASVLRGLMFIHLKQDLPGGHLAWEQCPSYPKTSSVGRSVFEKIGFVRACAIGR